MRLNYNKRGKGEIAHTALNNRYVKCVDFFFYSGTVGL